MKDLLELIAPTITATLTLTAVFILRLLRKDRDKSLTLLLVYFITVAMAQVPPILCALGGVFRERWFSQFAMYITWFMSAFALYRYVYYLLIQKHEKTYKWLYSCAIACIIVGGVGMLTEVLKMNFFTNTMVFLYQLTAVLFTLVIYFILILHIVIHNRQLKEEYSSVEHRNLNWLIVLLEIYLGASLLISMLRGVVPVAVNSCLGMMIQLSWLITFVYKALLHQASKSWIRRNIVNSTDEADENAKMLFKLENYQEHFSNIEHVICSQELFLNIELTIADVAKETHFRPWEISQAIHLTRDVNFSTYINTLRINYAKKILVSERNLSIEGIGRMSGFKSNSAFYRAFKKNCQTTPRKYQKVYMKS